VAEYLIAIENREDWKQHYPDLPIALVSDYLDGDNYGIDRDLRILNLCRSYRYLSEGYYCSLLAEARGHRVVPTVRTINHISRKSIYSLDFDSLDTAVRRAFRNRSHTEDRLAIDIFFGHCDVPEMEDMARSLADIYRVPLLRAEFRKREHWRLETLRPLHLHQLTPAQETGFLAGLSAHLGKRWRKRRARNHPRYHLAILHDPQEVFPPSDARALNAFVRAGREEEVNVELIQKRDYNHLGEYDALFIRETTGINHHTFRFAKKAETEGMPVIDDPDSILGCTNKVYLAELLRTHRIPTPKTLILRRDALAEAEEEIAYPTVLKIPDGSFSRGVVKAENRDDLYRLSNDLFKTSDLILAQEFLYTPFDWRVGILNGNPLYVCQYFMPGKHWQIYHHSTGKKTKSGRFQTLSVAEAPAPVVRVAVRAAKLIGNGLYGVDVKQIGQRAVVIEVNDNPNIDAGVEDKVLQTDLYRAIIGEFVRRLNAQTR